MALSSASDVPDANAAAAGGAQTPPAAIPEIAAAFLVTFDHRKGYTITWHKALPDTEIEGVVEFKCLPSGLHNVPEDLVYFVHDEYVGISAFLQKVDEESERNARMLAVGVLIPLEHGRMGKSWLHAEGLMELARHQIEKSQDYTKLEEYWDAHKVKDGDEDKHNGKGNEEDDDKNTNGYRRSRGLSIGTSMFTAHALVPHHPALAIPKLLEIFGPLIFPLFRAALLRKRILILGEAPVELTCNFVNNISIFSSMSKSYSLIIPIDQPADFRMRPLFNVGIADITFLSELPAGQGWIACTTDDVLCTKTNIFDLLVLLPGEDSQNAEKKVWPKLINSSPELAKAFPKHGIRATQRDARRFQTLKKGLHSYTKSSTLPGRSENSDGDTASIASSVSSIAERKEVVEPIGWSLMAYTSLIWWASAGEKRNGLAEAEETEYEQDAELLTDPSGQGEQPQEVAAISYFHALSNIIISTLSQAVKRADANSHDLNQNGDEQEDDEDQSLIDKQDDTVEVTADDISMMGLDIWSATDQQFIQEMVSFWWGRAAVVKGGTVECCGLRVL